MNRTTNNACSRCGDVRLVNGTGSYEGRVEICLSGVWKAVCDYRWNNLDAGVVCAQLNYLPQGIVHSHNNYELNLWSISHTDGLALNRAAFGQGNGSVLEYIYCSGSESRITDCRYTDYSSDYRCSHAGVRCSK